MARAAGSPTAGFVVLRAPLLSFDELLALNEGLRAPAASNDPAALEEAIAHDRSLLRARLAAWAARPEVREALFLASPDLFERHEDGAREDNSSREDNGAREDKGARLELALARYFFRMCGRGTPFGLFAGCTVGDVGPRTSLWLGERAACRRHTRLDNDYLFALVDRLERLDSLKDTLRFSPNSTLYEVGGSLRYSETRLDGKLRTNHLVTVTLTDYLRATIERSRGATMAELAQALVDDDPDIELEEARAYVEELVQSQILVSDLAPAVTGREPLDDLVDRLEPHPAANEAVRELRACRDSLAELDRLGLGNQPDRYREIARRLEALPAPVEPSRLFQVDLIRPAAPLELGEEPLAEIVRGVHLLHRLFGADEKSPIDGFRSAFLARYEFGEIPLVEALDEDIGLEFHIAGRSAGGAPLLKGIDLPAGETESATWTRTQRFLFRKLVEAISEGRQELALEPDDLEETGGEEAPALPAAFAVQATLCARSSEAVARGEFRLVLLNAMGPSGATFFGRFCHADPELCLRVGEHLRAEERHQPDAVFAEIVHLPEGRVGNVIVRPVLRDFEIPYLGRSSAPPDQQLPITDLMLSMAGDRLVLRSRRLNREVLPRMTNAHNYGTRSLPIYRFLAALQKQDQAPWLMWNWGPLSSSPFLPRVTSGRLVLAPACWRLSGREAKEMRAAPAAQRYRMVQQWRAQRRVPRYVVVVDFDNRLPIDLDGVLSVDVLVDLVARASGSVLEELIPAPEDMPVRGPEGRYVHEMVIPFVQPVAQPPRRRPAPRPAITIPRRFAPGSECLYLKLYSSVSHADRLLHEVVGPTARRSVASGEADQWFFIRYNDPDPHLRVRLHGTADVLWNAVFPAFRAAVEPMRDAGILWRLQLDTYDREVERYGGDGGLPLSERLFFADSEAALDLLGDLVGDEGAELRWQLTLQSIDRLLEDFGFSSADKRGVVSGLRDALAKSLRIDKGARIQLGRKFRSERSTLERLLETARGDADAPPGEDVLRRRSRELVPIATQLRSLGAAGRLDLPALASSYVHMVVNRMLRSDHQTQEFVLYEFLDRLYESRTARKAVSSPAPAVEAQVMDALGA